MSEQLEVTRSQNLVLVKTPTCLDLRMWHPLHTVAKRARGKWSCCHWSLDMTHTTRIHDSGLAALIRFRAWLGVPLAVKNVAPHIRRQLVAAGVI